MDMMPVLATSNVTSAADLSAAGGGPGLQPSVYDIAGFRDAWNNADVTKTAATQEAPLAAGSVSDSEGMRAVFSALDSLNGRAESLEAKSEIFTTGERDMTPSDMLMLTVQAHEFLFHAQLTANVANRTSDGIQQLFRQQT